MFTSYSAISLAFRTQTSMLESNIAGRSRQRPPAILSAKLALFPGARNAPRTLPLAHGTFALNIRRAGFEAYNVLLFHQKFSRVFDSNDSLRIWDVAREHIEQRGFAGAGATRNQEIQAAFHHRREQFQHGLGHGLVL